MTSGIAAKFLDPRQIEEALVQIRELTSLQNIGVALVGGAAMQLYGSDRLTKDVDFVAEAVPTGVIRKRKLTFGGYVTETRTGIPVDFIVRRDDFASLYEDALLRARNMGVGVRVVRPEHLAAMKLVAQRDKDELDLKTLINSGHLDLKKAKSIIKKHLGAYAVLDFESYVLEAEWRKNKEK